MFTESRFFSLARKYVKNGDAHRLGILKTIMNLYFDSLYPGNSQEDVIKIPKKAMYSEFDVGVVLSDVGYSDYSIKIDKNYYVVTLRNIL